MVAQRSIGQVLAVLRADHPDISISKIRFLESEGLIAPERAASGYRRYGEGDVERLRYILKVQRDHYLPLKVIREHLDMMDRGMQPPAQPDPSPRAEGGAAEAPAAVEVPAALAEPVATAASPTALARERQKAKPALRLSRKELLEASGLAEPVLVELERQQIVVPRRGTGFYGRDALTIAFVARRLAEYGMDARHLRAFKMAADREAGLVDQAIAPFLRRTSANRNVTAEVSQLVIAAHAALLRTALER